MTDDPMEVLRDFVREVAGDTTMIVHYVVDGELRRITYTINDHPSMEPPEGWSIPTEEEHYKFFQVAHDDLGDKTVSTVLLKVAFDENIYETMVFPEGSSMHTDLQRYPTREEAEIGHALKVAQLQERIH